jgi:hypothetical protein
LSIPQYELKTLDNITKNGSEEKIPKRHTIMEIAANTSSSVFTMNPSDDAKNEVCFPSYQRNGIHTLSISIVGHTHHLVFAGRPILLHIR